MLGSKAKTGYVTGYEMSGPSQTPRSGEAFGPHFLFNV